MSRRIGFRFSGIEGAPIADEAQARTAVVEVARTVRGSEKSTTVSQDVCSLHDWLVHDRFHVALTSMTVIGRRVIYTGPILLAEKNALISYFERLLLANDMRFFQVWPETAGLPYAITTTDDPLFCLHAFAIDPAQLHAGPPLGFPK